MINNILITLALTCPTTYITNKTNDWNVIDQASLDKAKVRCGQIYKQSPCLVHFVKKDSNAYWAICGAKR